MKKYLILVVIFITMLGNNFKVYGKEENKEVRAVWLTTVYNIDWPASKDYNNIEEQKSSLSQNMQFVKEQNLNTVFFQVRGMGDALFPSSYAPWSRYLTGVFGKNPGYDPLKLALYQAHRRGLEFHAWFNPFRIDANDKTFNKEAYISSLPTGSPLKNNPNWIVKYGQYHWLDIGIPEVRDYVMNIILEVVKNYDVDGVHIDDYFYPYPIKGIEFPDNNTYAKYGKGYSNIGDFRRDNVNKFIKELNNKIKSIKPGVKFGVSPFGVWRNGTALGGTPTNSLSSYDSLYADSKKWVEEEWIDYIVPQIYWEFENKTSPYGILVDWWSRIVQGKSVKLYIGHAAYKVGESATYGAAWGKGSEMENQIKYARDKKNVNGSSFFSLRDLKNNKLGMTTTLKNIYSSPLNINKNSWVIENTKVKLYFKKINWGF
ncbi:glycoside hydrolase family 10 protein [Clostridium malenominatum]|uniref:Glycoside hydrolase family 10 protein n=1 Tax=Clostridium malenominatum TaxID=1539 RepID=A0ABP3TZ49_9CLOT